MASEEQKQAAYDAIYLTACGINGKAPEIERISKMDLEAVCSVCSSLSLTAITCMALESAYDGKLPERPVFQKWEDKKNFSLYRDTLFEIEKDRVTKFLRENGIWYCLLKGMVLKTFYPEPGMREMCDVDILFDENYSQKVSDWFLGRGYEAKENNGGTGNVDSYLKQPVYNFEMHRSLLAPYHKKTWIDYYENVKDRLISNPDEPSEFHFNDEDFYVFLLVHVFKHYYIAGTGLRSLLDVYVYLKAKGDKLDREYVDEQLLKLGIKDFGDKAEACAFKTFSDPVDFLASGLSADEKDFLDSFLFSGTYGTLETKIKNGISLITPNDKSPSVPAKLKYIRNRLFPAPETLKGNYPFFNYPWEYPIGYLYRIFSRAAVNGKRILYELKVVRKM